MTIREMAEVAGVSPETVRAKAKEMYPDKFMKGKKTVFNQQEAIPIMAELRKRGFVQPTENLEVVTRADLMAMVVPFVAETIKQLIPVIQSISQGRNETDQLAELKPALPPISPRKELNLLASNAGRALGSYSEPWNQIYKNAYYRLGINLRERAKNRGMDTLDYAEAEGYMPQLVAIAREIFK